jgi:hypothetical protein
VSVGGIVALSSVGREIIGLVILVYTYTVLIDPIAIFPYRSIVSAPQTAITNRRSQNYYGIIT